MLYKDQYFDLKELLEYCGTQLSKNYAAVTLSELYSQFDNTSQTLLNLTALESIFHDYIIPRYIHSSCFKITTPFIYSNDLEVADILTHEELYNFTSRIRVFCSYVTPLIDKMNKYTTLIGNLATGKKKTTKAVLKNNDTPQIEGTGDEENDGFVNNVQINTGSEDETLAITEQLEAMKYIEDYKIYIAKEFENKVFID